MPSRIKGELAQDILSLGVKTINGGIGFGAGQLADYIVEEYLELFD